MGESDWKANNTITWDFNLHSKRSEFWRASHDDIDGLVVPTLPAAQVTITPAVTAIQ